MRVYQKLRICIHVCMCVWLTLALAFVCVSFVWFERRAAALVCINFVGGGILAAAIVCVCVCMCVQEEPVVYVCASVVNVNGFAFCLLFFLAHCAAPAG